MELLKEKLRVTCEKLHNLTILKESDISEIFYTESEYKKSNKPPQNGWKLYTKGVQLLGKDKHFWFKANFKSGKDIADTYRILSFFDSTKEDNIPNPQGILYLNGEMVQGIDSNHIYTYLNPDTEYEMYLYLYTAFEECITNLKFNEKVIDKNTENLYYDISVPFKAAQCFADSDYRNISICKHIESAVNKIDFRKPYSTEYYKSVESAKEYMYNKFYNGFCRKEDPTVSCIGHSHIDVAWLWTIEQTREKVQRSFSTVLRLMEEYPEYVFMSSQPQLYKYLKEEAPEVYEKVKKRVDEGRWEPEGGMWLESDCNLTSGESLIRQIMFGKRFIKEEFGKDTNIVWLPDTFGFSAALPQILKQSGIDTFVTSKISWNDYDKMPNDTFMWEGIDGTEIFAYFLTGTEYNKGASNFMTTYNGILNPATVLGTWERYQNKDFNTNVLLAYGYGDGGGGPTADMIENGRRLSYGIKGFPTTVFESANDFFARAKRNFEKSAKELKRTPKWVGELYLELHRGTYTSMARNKKYNRKSELLYKNAELFSAIDMILNAGQYPQKDINKNWEVILLNQFHDILPGSAIEEVYNVSRRQYKKLISEGKAIEKDKLLNLAEKINTNGGILVYNPNGMECSGTINLDGKLCYVENVPSFGWRVVDNITCEQSVKTEKTRIENKFFCLKLDKEANIVSIYDKSHKREIIQKGQKANVLKVYEDMPRSFDAWEISRYYKRKSWIINSMEKIETITDGVRAGVEITRKYGESQIVQRIYLYNKIKRIDFDTKIDWKEKNVILKAEFPVDIHTNAANYDIQFGNISRQITENTTWEAAKFEVCAHQWADISEDDYGVSLLNDCKYGYGVSQNLLTLTLLKCSENPNLSQDREQHSFVYSLYPHSGDFKQGKTTAEAVVLNNPLKAVRIDKNKGTLPEKYSLFSCGNENILLDTVKKAEEDNSVILRLHEYFNRKSNIIIDVGFDFKEVYICDMLEHIKKKINNHGRKVSLKIRNYEIVTLKFII